MKPCGLCKFKGRGIADLNHHIETVHKLTPEQYKMAADTVRQALAPVQMINSAMRKAGMLAVLVALMLSGCRGVDRLLGQDKESDPTPPPPGIVSALGAWSGEMFSGDVILNGNEATLEMNISTQTAGAVFGTWRLMVPDTTTTVLVVGQGTIEGTVDLASKLTYRLIESPACANDAHGEGTIVGNTMNASWTGNTGCTLWFNGGNVALKR